MKDREWGHCASLFSGIYSRCETPACLRPGVRAGASAEHPPRPGNSHPPLIDTYQEREAVLWQQPILLDKPRSGHTGELGECVPNLVNIDHLLRVCTCRQSRAVVEHQGRQVGLWHKPRQREEMELESGVSGLIRNHRSTIDRNISVPDVTLLANVF